MKNVIRLFLICIRFIFSSGVEIFIRRKIRSLNSLWVSTSFKNCSTSVGFGKIGWIRGPQYISIGNNTEFEDYLFLTAWDYYYYAIKSEYSNTDYVMKKQVLSPTIRIGNHCNFGAFNHITCVNFISIGDHVLTGKWVTITDNSHGLTDIDSLSLPPEYRMLYSKGPVIIGDNVWIGDKVTILPNVRIGEGTVIAANSVVTSDIPSYCVYAGNKIYSKR